MLRQILLLPAVFLLLLARPQPLLAEDVPLEVAGFKLGADITDYPEIEYTNYLKEMVIDDWHGFRKGFVSYGTCAYPGEIVKLRMKYENSSKEFYELLLGKFKNKFGKPDEWKGDPFGILYIWKWNFTDDKGRKVSLILQHNLQNQNENIGNIVKLSFPDREEEERLCFIKFCEIKKTPEMKKSIQQRKKPDWDFMIPR